MLQIGLFALRFANVSNVLLQLPQPDNRWVLKFRGASFGPFDFRLAGWRDAHDLISARTASLVARVRLEQTGMAGQATLSGSGKSCADSYPEAVRKRIERWLKTVTRLMTMMDSQKSVMRRPFVFVEGCGRGETEMKIASFDFKCVPWQGTKPANNIKASVAAHKSEGRVCDSNHRIPRTWTQIIVHRSKRLRASIAMAWKSRTIHDAVNSVVILRILCG